ncbi:putative urease accessory protein UreF [Magnetofaba australis IT-1]|uniref:Urease accessory protein UreF n=2 Tax=Magnetofaba TaxID=1472292 RepID=A0A1Y2K5W4_9PROT|nr:putative urease accessory protein UreF [Magnetofaba australis IT-1]
MTTPEPNTLYALMTWLSPAFPVGSYTYSHGLEQMVEVGRVHDEASLEAWVGGVLRFGAGRNDALLLRQAWRAADVGSLADLTSITQFGAAQQPSAELHLETSAQGAAFVKCLCDAWPDPFYLQWAEQLRQMRCEPPNPVAVGAAAARHGVALEASLHAYLHALAANLISAGVRLIPLGQSAGQRITARLQAVVALCVANVQETPAEDWGGATALTDWASLQHETQYTRLFRS